MTRHRTITLADRTFSVPPLPLRINREVYPLCARLTAGDLMQRWTDTGGTLRLDDQEFADLSDIAFWLTVAAGAPPDREIFEQMSINQIQLLNAFFAARYQTGVWLESEPVPDDAPGEAKGTATPRKKRSPK